MKTAGTKFCVAKIPFERHSFQVFFTFYFLKRCKAFRLFQCTGICSLSSENFKQSCWNQWLKKMLIFFTAAFPVVVWQYKSVLLHRTYERGAGRDNDLGAHGLQKAHHEACWLQGVQQRAHGLKRAHRNDTEKLVCEDLFFEDHIKILTKRWHFSLKTFFFLEITWKPGQNWGIFPVCFGFQKTGDPWYLSWSRAHVRLSAPLLLHHVYRIPKCTSNQN